MIKQRMTYCVIIILGLVSCVMSRRGSEEEKKSYERIGNYEQALVWFEKNLRYQNDDPWDPAPEIGAVLKRGYGDCKMLAGAVSVILNNINVKSKIAVIKNGSWHMFNIVEKQEGFEIINNARLIDRRFVNRKEISEFYKVDEIIAEFDNYEEFRTWFNEEIFYKEGDVK